MLPNMIDVMYVSMGELEIVAMKVSREQMKANRQRILTEAGRLFRQKGFDAVGVAEVMNAAGLTHGGFYGHFSSKDDLIARTVAHMFEPADPDRAEKADLSDFMDVYLSPPHRQGVATGCPTAALVADIRRQGPDARKALTSGVRGQIERIAAAISDTPSPTSRRDATGAWATMVGAMIMARTIDDEALSDQILQDARDWIDARLQRRET